MKESWNLTDKFPTIVINFQWILIETVVNLDLVLQKEQGNNLFKIRKFWIVQVSKNDFKGYIYKYFAIKDYLSFRTIWNVSIYSLKVNVGYKLFSIKCWKEFETIFQSGIDRIKKAKMKLW